MNCEKIVRWKLNTARPTTYTFYSGLQIQYTLPITDLHLVYNISLVSTKW